MYNGSSGTSGVACTLFWHYKIISCVLLLLVVLIHMFITDILFGLLYKLTAVLMLLFVNGNIQFLEPINLCAVSKFYIKYILYKTVY